MSSTPDLDDTTLEIHAPPGTSALGLPVWKKLCLAAAGVLLVSGMALYPFEKSSGAPPERERIQRNPSIPPPALVDPVEPGRLVPDETRPPRDPPPRLEWEAEAESAEPPWSPALMKGGLSFLVGFCIGFVFRAFLKLTALVLGLNLAIYFGLSHAGVLEIHWEVLDGYFDRLVAGFGDDFSELRNFLTGSLPSAGLGALGLLVGYRKN